MSRGSYNTKQREFIYNYIVENKDKHITVENITDYLKSNDSKVGTTTVYRFLDILVNEGVVRKYASADGMPSCYQYVNESNCHNHYHLICNTCGKLFHIECEHLDSVENHILRKHNFKIDNLKTTYYGTCEHCAV